MTSYWLFGPHCFERLSELILCGVIVYELTVMFFHLRPTALYTGYVDLKQSIIYLHAVFDYYQFRRIQIIISLIFVLGQNKMMRKQNTVIKRLIQILIMIQQPFIETWGGVRLFDIKKTNLFSSMCTSQYGHTNNTICFIVLILTYSLNEPV